MPKYRVYYQAGAGTYVDVEAEDENDAADKADEVFAPPQLCAHCSGWDNPPGIDISDWEPCNEVPEVIE